jgi:hypothetical protein
VPFGLAFLPERGMIEDTDAFVNFVVVVLELPDGHHCLVVESIKLSLA